MTLGIGYCAGALAPLALGALRDATGSFDAGMWLIALLAVGTLAVRLACSPARPRAACAPERAQSLGGARSGPRVRPGRSTRRASRPLTICSSSSSFTSPRAPGSSSVVSVLPLPATRSPLPNGP